MDEILKGLDDQPEDDATEKVSPLHAIKGQNSGIESYASMQSDKKKSSDIGSFVFPGMGDTFSSSEEMGIAKKPKVRKPRKKRAAKANKTKTVEEQ